MTPEGIVQLQNDEGLNLMMYQDTTGHATIGWGHNLTNKPITIEAARIILDNDINDATNAASDYPWFAGLSPTRQDVVVNMIFNLGAAGFAEFHDMHNALLTNNWMEASTQLWNSMAAHQLPNRYRRLYWAMLTDTWEKTAWTTDKGYWPGDIGKGPAVITLASANQTA